MSAPTIVTTGASPTPGQRWIRKRGGTVWLPANVMRNADGVLRERWFA